MIKKVKKYTPRAKNNIPYGFDRYSVLYESGKLQHYYGRCPKTVTDFMATAKQTKQTDYFDETEIIYERRLKQ